MTEEEEVRRVMLDFELEDERTQCHAEENTVNNFKENLSTIASSVPLKRKRYNNDNTINKSVPVESGVSVFRNEDQERL